MGERKISTSSPLIGLAARTALAVASRLPLRLARPLGAGLGRLCWLLPNRLRRATRLNLDWCLPELAPRERRRLLRVSLVETGRTAGEFGAVMAWPAERLRGLVESIDGEELLEGALAAGGAGPLLLLPHLGNWELLNPLLMERTGFVALYRPPRIAEMDRLVVASRERTGCTMIPATPAGLRRLFRAVSEGRTALILPDQEPILRSGVFAPFFGVPALTMTLVARLIRRFHCPALYAFALRTASGRFRVSFREAPAGLDDPDPVIAAARLNFGVERCVRECPEQYAWSYKRFRTRPPDEVHRLRVLLDPTGVKLYRRRPFAKP